ncbi:ABC transporter permease subunit [Alicyclobacillus sp. ALC3]|uniref:ABC transporter permease subunit n=1 Tax=Alicyclobacillus sp. ALC3 TaxID=2796143 RepID=UPI002378E698|nr:ABC transporter permease subunit [Alicyclobacillus sp. ALC3]WDL96246.1 hypothetical protein JC200_18200 [Alicyclobacillus sp. ALC3]
MIDNMDSSKNNGTATNASSTSDIPSRTEGEFTSLLQRWFPRALVYREWRLNRTKYLLAGFLLVAAMVGQMLLQLTTPPYLSEVMRPDVVAVAAGNLSTSHVVLASVAAVLLGVLVLQGDTGKGAVFFTLSGPVKRKDLMRVKAGLGLTVIAVAYVVNWAILTCLAMQYPTPQAQPVLGVMGSVSFAHALISGALFLTGLAAAATCSNLVLAAGGAFLAAAVPLFVSNMLYFFNSTPFNGMSLGTPYAHWFNVLTSIISQASPLDNFHVMAVRTDSFTSLAGVVYALWFVAWSYGFWRLGAHLFEAASVERMSDTFFYPALWYVVLAGMCFIIANVFGHVFTDMQNGYIFMVWFVLFYGLSWFVIRRLVRTAGSRMEGRS